MVNFYFTFLCVVYDYAVILRNLLIYITLRGGVKIIIFFVYIMKKLHLINHPDSIELVCDENGHLTGVAYVPLAANDIIVKNNLKHHFVVFVLRGTIFLTCKHYETKAVNACSMTFVSKGGFFQVESREVNSSVLFFAFDEITIRTSESLMDFFSSHGNLSGYVHNTLPVNLSMKHIVDKITIQLRKGRIKNPVICQAWHTELFITFISYYTKTQVTEFFRPLVSTNINFKDFVENNYMEVYGNVEKLIQFSGLTHHTFNKRFKEEFGMTPKAWLTARFRDDLEYYSSLPNATTGFVASKLGITDVRLCQLTRKMYGTTPQQLIEGMKEKECDR